MSIIEHIKITLSNLHRIVFCIYMKRSKHNRMKTIILDIDNTITPTYYLHTHSNIIYYKYPIFRYFINMTMSNSLSNVYYISYRPFSQYYKTYLWLKQYGMIENIMHLVFVPTVDKKLNYLSCFFDKGSVEYYDDLSYHDAEGQHKFYSEIIAVVSTMDLNYHNYEELKKIQSIAD
jgi:hypothetical protein